MGDATRRMLPETVVEEQLQRRAEPACGLPIAALDLASDAAFGLRPGSVRTRRIRFNPVKVVQSQRPTVPGKPAFVLTSCLGDFFRRPFDGRDPEFIDGGETAREHRAAHDDLSLGEQFAAEPVGCR